VRKPKEKKQETEQLKKENKIFKNYKLKKG
jgi:hypothetical protein